MEKVEGHISNMQEIEMQEMQKNEKTVLVT